ncbi:hypothetical protein [Streptomyces sp. NBC_00347]|nr:hypothetical protein [Streptomyces sp. NBC_00347]MCX5129225.1 hypothetical protein [Streptomyces sp. NBC_00347]
MTGSSEKARASRAATAPDSEGRAYRMPYPAMGGVVRVLMGPR